MTGFTRTILGARALLAYAVRRVRRLRSFAQGEPQAVGGDHGQRPREADEPAGDDVGEPVVPEEDAGEAHRQDEQDAHRDGDRALPGGGRLDEDEVDDDRRQHGRVEGVPAWERRRGLERWHGERGRWPGAVDEVLAGDGHGEGPGGGDEGEDEGGP